MITMERKRLWDSLKAAYVEFRQNDSRGRETLRKAVVPAKAPPDILPRDGRPLKNWAIENEDKLGIDQDVMWKFVKAVYPPTPIGKRLEDGSIVDRDKFDEFHEARRKLAHFWNNNAKEMPVADMSEHVTSAEYDIILLIWLDIALKHSTEDSGKGKVGLYKLAVEMGGRAVPGLPGVE